MSRSTDATMNNSTPPTPNRDLTDAHCLRANVTRRRFLRDLGLTGLALTGGNAMVGLLEGCGGQGNPPAPPPLPTPAPTLNGTVVSVTGAPIAGATVSLSPQNVNTTTKVDGTYSVRVPRVASGGGGLADINVSAPGFITLTTIQIPIGEGSTTFPVRLNAASLPVSVSPGVSTSATDTTAPSNQNLAGTKPPLLNFPTGSVPNTGFLNVSVTATPPVDNGEWKLSTSTAPTRSVPTSPNVAVSFSSNVQNVSSAAGARDVTPPDATVSIPIYLPFARGSAVPIVLTSQGIGNLSRTQITGIMQSDGTALVNMRSALDALANAPILSRRLGRQTTGSTTSFTMNLGAGPIVISSPFLTVTPGGRGLTEVEVNTCDVSSDKFRELSDNGDTKILISARVTINGVDATGSIPSAFFVQLLAAAGAPPAPGLPQNNQVIHALLPFRVDVPGGLFGTKAAHTAAFEVETPYTVHGQGTDNTSYPGTAIDITIDGSYSYFSWDISRLQACSAATGPIGGTP